jgi:hypothetical protein
VAVVVVVVVAVVVVVMLLALHLIKYEDGVLEIQQWTFQFKTIHQIL